MTGSPIVLISHQRIKPGQIEAYRARYADALRRMFARPETLAHAAYMNEAGSEVSVVIAFADAEAMQAHFFALGSAPQHAQEIMDFVSIEIYGAPTPATLDTIHGMVGTGVPVAVLPIAIDGYIRSGSAAQ